MQIKIGSFMYISNYVTEVYGVHYGMAGAVRCAGAAVSLATLVILIERKE
jgi:hypothetical protein